MSTVLAVDGNSIINRAFFGAGRPLTNGGGQRTEAIYGTVNMILSAIDRVSPSSVVVAFDLPEPTFRHRMYDLYKSNRHGMPDDLASQLQPTQDLLAEMGFGVLTLAGYEADDILGTVARKAEGEGKRCVIFTGDRDSLQLISDRTSVLLAGKETLLFDRAAFREKYGVDPEQYVDAKALKGDASDCIPGVPGVGEKTALPLIAKFGSLDGVYGHLDDPFIKAGLRARLEAGRESALLSRTLAAIDVNVPLTFDFAPVTPGPGLREMLAGLGFASILSRLSFDAPEKRAPEEQQTLSKTVYTAVERPEDALPASGKPTAVAFDGDDLLLSSERGDFRLSSPGLPALKAVFNGTAPIVVCDAKALYARLSASGVPPFEASGDPSLAAYVLSSTDGDYSFAGLCLRHLGVAADAPDARLTLLLEEKLTARLEKEGALSLYRDIELPLCRVLFDCETAGVLIDRAGIARYGDKLLAEMKEAEEAVYALSGRVFNVNSPKQLGQVLFEEMGLVVPGMKKTQNGYSTSADVLEKLRYEPVVAAVLQYRRLAKLRSTYTEGLLKVVADDGRVHTRFTQTVTATGRLSSVEPNLQNIPVRTPQGRELRRYFIAPEGRVLVDADYSQIELRLLACLSKDRAMTDAFLHGVDIHTVTASQVFGVPEELVTSDLRKRAKAVNFGIVYGISAFSLSQDVGVTVREADRYIKNYFATYPGIERFLAETVEKAKAQGWVSTLFGRRRYIPELTSGKAAVRKFGERVAMNSPLQGTAADVIKIAMIRVSHALKREVPDARLILQVHDELIVECAEKDAASVSDLLRREMEGAVNLAVPLTVELNTGKTWYDCK